jgi:hypothetical protein
VNDDIDDREPRSLQAIGDAVSDLVTLPDGEPSVDLNVDVHQESQSALPHAAFLHRDNSRLGSGEPFDLTFRSPPAEQRP